MSRTDTHKNAIGAARRVVVKIGSRVLVQDSGRPRISRIRALVKELAALRHQGFEVILVSSGAIGAGMEALGIRQRPDNLPDLQMAAAVGQSRLMARYDDMFAREKCHVGQVLLTHDGLKQRKRHLNARNTLSALLRNGIVPVINENDAVAVEEIKFGDNDLLAALVALLVNADLLILLTTVNGLRTMPEQGRGRRISFLESVTDNELAMAQGKGGALSTGGMASKLQAAQSFVKAGGVTVLADGGSAGILARIMNGDDVGTLIYKPELRGNKVLSGRKRWIAFFHRAHGALIVDAGARQALELKGRSLLPIGIRKVQGPFKVGDAVNVKTLDGEVFARGLVEYDSVDTERIMGHKTEAIAEILGARPYDEVIHRDNMVILKTKKGEIA